VWRGRAVEAPRRQCGDQVGTQNATASFNPHEFVKMGSKADEFVRLMSSCRGENMSQHFRRERGSRLTRVGLCRCGSGPLDKGGTSSRRTNPARRQPRIASSRCPRAAAAPEQRSRPHHGSRERLAR
jgi:hypothetical protein